MEMAGKTRNLSDKTVDKREICLVAFCHANHHWPQKGRCILCCLNFKKSVFVGSYTIFFQATELHEVVYLFISKQYDCWQVIADNISHKTWHNRFLKLHDGSKRIFSTCVVCICNCFRYFNCLSFLGKVPRFSTPNMPLTSFTAVNKGSALSLRFIEALHLVLFLVRIYGLAAPDFVSMSCQVECDFIPIISVLQENYGIPLVDFLPVLNRHNKLMICWAGLIDLYKTPSHSDITLICIWNLDQSNPHGTVLLTNSELSFLQFTTSGTIKWFSALSMFY